ncbi:MAG TPA: cupin domain-containing protein [Kofleriaceae bacterium]|nr:cupin domain-containing protein [Kofleriaceae bacterium]
MNQRTPNRRIAPWSAWVIAGALAVAPATAHAHPSAAKFEHAIPNVPGKSLIVIEVDVPPGETGRPHHHARSAFICAYMLSGTIRSQVEGEPAHDYHAGDTWYELPGAHHVVSRNPSPSQPAKFLAVFVVDSNDKPLTTPDPE